MSQLLLALAAAAAVFALASWESQRRRRRALARLVSPWAGNAAPAQARRSFFERLDPAVAHGILGKPLAERLERAGIARRASEVVAATVGVSLLLVLAAAVGGSGAFVVAAAFLPATVVWTGLGLLARRRLRAFDRQLPDLLSGLAASLRAGHALLRSLEGVAQHAPEPAGRELRRALAEARLGRPVEEALADISRRIPSQELHYVLTAIAVQREVGGSLASLVETVAETVRQRQQFVRKLRALTATGRTSAYVLVALPFAVALLLTLINHAYLAPLTGSQFGRLLILGSLVLMGAGFLVVRRIVSFEE